jgi:hypothetical protein
MQDEQQIHALVKKSGLYKPKWDRPDYPRRTIGRALGSLTERPTRGLRNPSKGGWAVVIYQTTKAASPKTFCCLGRVGRPDSLGPLPRPSKFQRG